MSKTIESGSAAPTAKVDAEVSAAWTGRAVVTSEMPSSSRACAPSASFAISYSVEASIAVPRQACL
jgi:hypothetical protein